MVVATSLLRVVVVILFRGQLAHNVQNLALSFGLNILVEGQFVDVLDLLGFWLLSLLTLPFIKRLQKL